MANVFLPNKFAARNKNAGKIDKFVFGKRIGVITKLFGCWHNDVSRPFVQGKTAYRSCLQCGARKQFNPETLETTGGFYFPPVIKEERV